MKPVDVKSNAFTVFDKKIINDYTPNLSEKKFCD